MIKSKQLIQTIVNKFGYKIYKIRERKRYPVIDVFNLVVQDYLSKIEHNVFFLQIGANDGIRADPIHKYIKTHHWCGLLVEPQPQIFKKLVSNYQDEKQLKLENAMIGHEDGTATLYTVGFKERGLPSKYSGIARLNCESLIFVLERNGFSNPGTLIEEINVPSLTISSLLSKHNVKKIDILQIDTEGFDYEIIKMFDFDLIKPPIIQFEHFNLSLDDQEECFDLLASQGYRLCSVLGDTIAYLID